MSFALSIDDLERAGISISLAPPDRLIVTPASALTQDLRIQLRAAKDELVHQLRERIEEDPAMAVIRKASVGTSLSPDEIAAALAPADWADLRSGRIGEAAIRDFAGAIEIRRARERGEAPPGWTQVARCQGCGLVWLWEGAPVSPAGCPWCLNRAQGRPIPRPPHR